jgi:hypothetical protein
MIKKFLILVGLIATTSAFAQADKFSGFSVGLNAGFETLTTKAVFNTAAPANTSAAFGNSATPFDINLSYLFPISSNATLGLGVSYDLSKIKSVNSADNSGAVGVDNTLSNHYSINIEPGYAYNDSLLGYFKLAYHSANQKTTENTTPLTLIDKKSTGMGYGFGTRYLIDKNLYLNLEIQKISFNKVDQTVGDTNRSIQTSGTVGTVGIGYKF